MSVGFQLILFTYGMVDLTLHLKWLTPPFQVCRVRGGAGLRTSLVCWPLSASMIIFSPDAKRLMTEHKH
jgi:hypothetical protein